VDRFDRRTLNRARTRRDRDQGEGGMKVNVQVVVHADDSTQTVVREAFTLITEALAPDTPGLQLQTRFAGLVSYGLSADLLNEILPLGRTLHATTLRRQVQATA
jgi:hypothetical protein